MLSNDDHPGLFTFMIGLIVVVLAGVGLSLVVDRKFSFSRSVSDLDNGIEAGAAEIDQLKDQLQQVSRELAASEPRLRMVSTNHESIRRQLAAGVQRHKSLIESLENLRESTSATEEEFLRYRAKYREQTWAGAVGESLGNLTARGGREYRQVVISRVTAVGLEIRHADGIARLQAPELDRALQDRFQWNDEERRTRLSEEQAAHESLTGMPDAPQRKETRPEKPVRESRDEGVPDAARISSLRTKVAGWKAKVSQLNSDRNQALSAASYGSQSSVPGSLETWQAKAARLGTELAKAKSELAAAKVALAAVSPDDPLLRPDPVRD